MAKPTSGGIVKNVLVLKYNDVTRRDGEVLTPNYMNLAKLRKCPTQFNRDTEFTTYMTENDVKSKLEGIFPILKNQRFSCATAVKDIAKLDFNGDHRVWDGNTLKTKLKGNKALYIVMEDEMPQRVDNATVSSSNSAAQYSCCQGSEPSMDVSRTLTTEEMNELLDTLCDMPIPSDANSLPRIPEDNLPLVRPQLVVSETVTGSVPATTTGGIENLQEVSQNEKSASSTNDSGYLTAGSLSQILQNSGTSRQTSVQQNVGISLVGNSGQGLQSDKYTTDADLLFPYSQAFPNMVQSASLLQSQSTGPFDMANTAVASGPQITNTSGPLVRPKRAVKQTVSETMPVATTSGLQKQQELPQYEKSAVSGMADSGYLTVGGLSDNQYLTQILQHRGTSQQISVQQNVGLVGNSGQGLQIDDFTIDADFLSKILGPFDVTNTVGQGQQVTTMRVATTTGTQKQQEVHETPKSAKWPPSKIRMTDSGCLTEEMSAATCNEAISNTVPSGTNFLQSQMAGRFDNANTAITGSQITSNSCPLVGPQAVVDGSVNRSAATTSGMQKQQEKLPKCSAGMKRKVGNGYSADGNLSGIQHVRFPQSNTPRQNPKVDIRPAEKSVEGGGYFHLEFPQGLSDEVRSGWARFGNSKPVEVNRLGNKLVLVGENIPCAPGMKPRVVSVKVTTQNNDYLGDTLFTYVDQKEKEEQMMTNLLSDQRKLGKFFKMYAKTLQKKGLKDEDTKSNPLSALSSHGSMQSLKVLQAFVYIAARVEHEQFIELLFGSSAGRIIVEVYKNKCQLPEDIADSSSNRDMKYYLQEITKRFLQNSEAGPTVSKEFDWSGLSKSTEADQAKPTATTKTTAATTTAQEQATAAATETAASTTTAAVTGTAAATEAAATTVATTTTAATNTAAATKTATVETTTTIAAEATAKKMYNTGFTEPSKEKSKLQQEDSFETECWGANALSVSSSGPKLSDSNVPVQKKSCYCISTRCPPHSDSTRFPFYSDSTRCRLHSDSTRFPLHSDSTKCPVHSDSTRFPLHSDSTRCRLHADSRRHFLHSDSTRLPLHSDSKRYFLHSDSGGHEQETYFGDQPYRRWILGTLVGTGAFGKVYTCFSLDRGTKTPCAVKRVRIEPWCTDSVGVAALKNEISILKSLIHERIVPYYGCEERDGHLHLFMEFMAGGPLSDHIKENGVLFEGECRRYTWQILEGVSFLHSKLIIHRDIKGSNVLLDGKGNVKLTDFGLSKIMQKIGSKTNLVSLCGTPFWMAPEIFSGKGYGLKTDIWSVGCTVVEMLTGKPPLGHLDPLAAIFRIGCGPTVPTLPENVSQAANEFIKAALTWNPEERPCADDLLLYEFAACKVP